MEDLTKKETEELIRTILTENSEKIGKAFAKEIMQLLCDSTEKIKPDVSKVAKFDITDEKNLKIKVTKFLTNLGMSRKLRGFDYNRIAIMLIIKDKSYKQYITKGLYVEIAKQCDTTPTRVERAMRHAIEICWEKGNYKVINEIFSYTVNPKKGKPTNSEFICLIADEIENQ